MIGFFNGSRADIQPSGWNLHFCVAAVGDNATAYSYAQSAYAFSILFNRQRDGCGV